MPFRTLLFAATVIVMAGCHFADHSMREDFAGHRSVDFKDSLADFATKRADHNGRHLSIEEANYGSDISGGPATIRQVNFDGSVEESTVVDRFETAPLEDFSFSNDKNFRRLRLEDCLRMALANSPVVRDLGGIILRAPDSVATGQDPALAYLDPRFGEEAALSAFDANYRSQLLFQKNDNLFNNQFVGDEGAFQQDLARYSAGISKTSATGAQFGVNQVVDYELNNSPSNRFNGNRDRSFAYDLAMEAEFRQPLLQGAGTRFNRIAGPNNSAGVYNGVSIARTNTDIALADFETKIRDLISDVENTYWDLYFSYRDLESRIDARNGAYEIWQNLEANRAEKSAAIIGQAKEQYYRFAADVEEAIHGRLNEGTRTNNGSSSGTFRRSGGVRTTERRLRLITGMPLNDQQLVVPDDVPANAVSVFDWESIRENALTKRPELRRQRWKLKRRELELMASKNLLLPRIDMLGKYRLKGFGHNLFGNGNELQQDGNLTTQLDSSAYAGLFDGDLQEWEFGFDASIPIGFRQQHAAVRHAQMSLARERSVLAEQQRQIIFGLSNALGELRRADRVRDANKNRLDAANEQFAAIQNIYREQDTTIDLVLEAQRRVIEAKLQYFQSQVEYMLAIKAIHFEQGTLFHYHGILFGEREAECATFGSADYTSTPITPAAIDYSMPVSATINEASPAPSLPPAPDLDPKTTTLPASEAETIDPIQPAESEIARPKDLKITAPKN